MVYDFEREYKDALLAISCFFELFQDMRAYLRTVWTRGNEIDCQVGSFGREPSQEAIN